jgi:hypothetical protein
MPKKTSTTPKLTVPVANLSSLKMVSGGEKKHPVVIHNGYVKTWVGFGWVTGRKATKKDTETIPTAV